MRCEELGVVSVLECGLWHEMEETIVKGCL